MQKPDNFILVIFGASGDLTKRKLIPALFDLYCQQMIANNFKLLGCGITHLDDSEFKAKMKGALEERFPSSGDIINAFIFHLPYSE